MANDVSLDDTEPVEELMRFKSDDGDDEYPEEFHCPLCSEVWTEGSTCPCCADDYDLETREDGETYAICSRCDGERLERMLSDIRR